MNEGYECTSGRVLLLTAWECIHKSESDQSGDGSPTTAERWWHFPAAISQAQCVAHGSLTSPSSWPLISEEY